MKYLKTFESKSHWTEELYDKSVFDRKDELKDLTYSFIDELSMVSVVDWSLRKNGFESPGRLQDYFSDDTNLYKYYLVQIYSQDVNIFKDVDKLILYKELEIELINRLKDIGYIINYKNDSNSIRIELYHPIDIIDKSLFLKDYHTKDMLNNKDLFEFLKQKFGKISNIWLSQTNDIIVEADPYDKYTIDDLYNFITKTLGNKYSLTKTNKDTNTTVIKIKSPLR